MGEARESREGHVNDPLQSELSNQEHKGEDTSSRTGLAISKIMDGSNSEVLTLLPVDSLMFHLRSDLSIRDT